MTGWRMWLYSIGLLCLGVGVGAIIQSAIN